jgi:hypothetical protein
METEQTIICLPFDDPKKLSIRLPFGGKLEAISDLSKGVPKDCTLVHGLMLQLAPTLAGMQCFIKILKLIQTVQNLLKNFNAATFIKDVTPAIGEVANCCFGALLGIPTMIIDILKLIIAYLKCIIEAVSSILNFQLGINASDEEDNPNFTLAFNCAQGNVQASTQQLKDALEVIEPLISLLQDLMEGAQDPSGLIDPAKEAIATISAVIPILRSFLESGGATAGLPDIEEIKKILDSLKEQQKKLEDVQETLEELSPSK